jgi:hypothetical protein
MSVSVDDKVRPALIDDDSQLAVAKHPVLGDRFSSKRRRGWSEVKCRDPHVGVEGKQRTLERLTFATGPDRKPLECPRVDRRWPLVRPEATAPAGRPGNPDTQSVRQSNDRGTTVQHLDGTALERPPERCPAQRSQVMVAQHRDHW